MSSRISDEVGAGDQRLDLIRCVAADDRVLHVRCRADRNLPMGDVEALLHRLGKCGCEIGVLLHGGGLVRQLIRDALDCGLAWGKESFVLKVFPVTRCYTSGELGGDIVGFADHVDLISDSRSRRE
jgi:hypothetical protein